MVPLTLSGVMAFRVLFVEDDPALALMYRTGLEARGYDVAVARDGCAGLEMARTWGPDLLLLDVGLPGLDGVQVLEHVRRDEGTCRMPVVVLSNEDDHEVVQRCRRLGIVDWRLKVATTPALLMHVIESWRAACGAVASLAGAAAAPPGQASSALTRPGRGARRDDPAPAPPAAPGGPPRPSS